MSSCLIYGTGVVKCVVLSNVTFSPENSSEEHIAALVSRHRFGSLNLDRFCPAKRALKSKCLWCHLSRLILLALHLKLLSLGKEFVDFLLHNCTVHHLPSPLIAALRKLMPCDQPIFIFLPVREESPKLWWIYVGDFTNNAFVLHQPRHHRDKTLFGNGFLSFGV